MTAAIDALTSVPGVCDLSIARPAGTPRGWVLVEVPHGATRTEDYAAVAGRLRSRLPAQLDHFFYVNTDIGAPEGAAWLAQSLPRDGLGVVVARCLIPRTFIDSNRVIAQTKQGVVVDGLTPAVPGYIDDADDARWLEAQHAAYHALVGRAYDAVCGALQGVAVQLHSFSPRSVNIEKTDAGIVEALHQAYVPAVYETWPKRPAVDLICATSDGAFRTAPALVAATKQAYAAAGITAEENATYHLHPATQGLAYARRFPSQVLCLEWNRDLVADPFVPFGPSPINSEKVARMAAPLAQVLRAPPRT